MYKRKQTKKSGKYIIEWWDDLQHNTIFDVVKYSESSSIFFSDFKYFGSSIFFLHNSNFFFAKSRTYLDFQEIKLLKKKKKIIDIYFFVRI